MKQIKAKHTNVFPMPLGSFCPRDEPHSPGTNGTKRTISCGAENNDFAAGSLNLPQERVLFVPGVGLVSAGRSPKWGCLLAFV